MISAIEKLLKKLHSYFKKSRKRHLEVEKLSELLHSKRRKILNNVKTRWINMLSPLKRVLVEYHVFVCRHVYKTISERSRG
jgi:16S rRNA C1402 (ribose-2'-O) methylase RsmI